MTLATSLLHALKDHGATEIFGIPGDFALPFFKAIDTSAILPYHTLSHEPAVGFAADGSARFRGALGVAVVTYGAGALNMVNAVAGAYSERTPLVVISGAPGRLEGGRGLLLHHQAKTLDSQYRIYTEITCDQAVLNDTASAPATIARVLRSCREHSRPVYLELPRDMVDAPCAPVTALPATPVDPAAVAACADEVFARLQAGRAPALLAGIEVRRFGLEDKVAELCRRLGLPVATTFMGRGLLAGSDCALIGTYLGLAGRAEVNAVIENADPLLMLGAILSDTNLGVATGRLDLRAAIQAEGREVRLGHHLYPDIPLAPLLDALLERAQPLTGPPPRVVPAPAPRNLPRDERPVTPLDIATAINDLFDRHGPLPLAADIGDCLFTAMDIDNAALAAPGYYASMGFGVPAGLGIQAASGQRPIILVGDGAFQMTGWEIGNATRNGWDPIVLVFNNASWEMLATFQPDAPYNRLETWQFAELAGALGGDGVRVATRGALADALETAISRRGRFQLIDIMLERGCISPTLQRFVDAQRQLTGMK